MKTNAWLLSLVVGLLWNTSYATEDFSLLMEAKLIVDDEQDRQFLNCDTYVLEDEIIFDAPNLIRLYENELYLLNFDFAAFLEQNKITYQDYRQKGYQMQVKKTKNGHLNIRAVSPKPEFLLIDIGVIGPVAAQDELMITLVDQAGTEVAMAAFGVEILQTVSSDRPPTLFNLIREFVPAVVRLEESNNTNNVVQRELTYSGDTINLDASKSYDFYLEIPKIFHANGKDYSVVADWENPLNYEISYKWENPLVFKATDRNRFKGVIVAKPGNSSSGNRPVNWFTSEYVQSQLPKTGTRIIQKVELIPATSQREYAESYLQKYQRKSNILLQGKSTNKKAAEQTKLLNDIQLNYYRQFPTQQQGTSSQISTKKKQTNTRVSATKSATRSSTTNRVRTSPTTRSSGSTKSTTQTRSRLSGSKTAAAAGRPTLSQTNAQISRTPAAPVQPKSEYHTLMINICNDLEEIECSPVRVTFRLIK